MDIPLGSPVDLFFNTLQIYVGLLAEIIPCVILAGTVLMSAITVVVVRQPPNSNLCQVEEMFFQSRLE